MSESILKGIRVVENARFVAAPMCTRMLAALGAEVIKIEGNKPFDQQRTDSDGTRDGYRWPDSAALKKSFGITLRYPESIQLVTRLLEMSDVFVENWVPDVPAKLGLNYEEIRKKNPKLIICRMPGLGLTGPFRSFMAYGLSCQALGGLDDINGYPGRPIGPNFSFPDYTSGIHAGLSVIAALEFRRRTGRGQILEVPLYPAMSSVLGSAPLEYSANNISVKGNGNRDRYMFPHNAYPCQGEDRWCVIAVRSDAEWASLCKVLGNPAWVKPAYDTVLGRKADIDEIDRQIQAWTSARTAEDVMEMLQKAGIPSGVVAKGSDVMSDPHLKERNCFFTTHNHPRYGDHPSYPVPPIGFSATPCIFGPAPKMGEHNDYVCGDLLGLSKAEIAQLAEKGIFES
jgi:benzylsuccinate CoA-transferase BbsF subunit